jgi:diguanylate cyclase (GGDEF)-like protein
MDMFGIALFDPDRNQLVYRRYYEEGVRKNEHRIDVNSESSFAAWAFKNRKPVLISDKDAEYSNYLSKPSTRKGLPSQSVVCMPLSIEDRAIGVMTLQNYKVRAYAPHHLAFIEALAPYVGIAVENAIIHDRLEDLNRALSDEKRRLERATLKISHLANHDTLTGLPNRRLLFELMGKTVETARRTNGKVGVVFIDLDDFKPINDEFGHAAGDSALVAMSERIRGLVRASDIVARIGGDEFVAVITNVKNRDDIERVARKIISECASPLSFSGKTSRLGMSMGISVFPDDGESIEDLVNKADSAMYRVKHFDKNSYAFSSDVS